MATNGEIVDEPHKTFDTILTLDFGLVTSQVHTTPSPYIVMVFRETLCVTDISGYLLKCPSIRQDLKTPSGISLSRAVETRPVLIQE